MKKFHGKVNILHLIDGAKQAEGLTVIIDVFRAFSLENYLYDMGVELIRPVGTIEDAFRLKETTPNSLLFGERNGIKVEGFDFGNSPSSVTPEIVKGKTILHTTSAGTQGVVNAKNATKILAGSLVNAKAVAEYIIETQPEVVSLVCMGWNAEVLAAEDELCAEYIKSILDGEELPNMDERVADLQFHGGEHFFNPETQEVFPEPDFWLCIKYNRFPYILEITKDEIGYVTKRIR
ncbi:MAG: 2-phosphosulfolactate phosphatase [Acidaminococcaceae bacterium]|nr:2-phosphosulfolactate phosphatase [Acidaminococcaceae bacterium]